MEDNNKVIETIGKDSREITNNMNKSANPIIDEILEGVNERKDGECVGRLSWSPWPPLSASSLSSPSGPRACWPPGHAECASWSSPRKRNK